MARRERTSALLSPYLKRIWLDKAKVPNPEAYPFCLPFLNGEFSLEFDRAVTIIVGENGTGKSTLLEGIAALAGYDEAGGGKGYRPVDHSQALEVMGGRLSNALRRAGCLRSREAGSSARRAFSPSPATSTKRRSLLVASHQISCRTPMVKAFCDSSRSGVNARALSSSMNRSRRSRPRGRSNS
jgi:energy-coupling factor transporter ATP-binding protein EcfA2